MDASGKRQFVANFPGHGAQVENPSVAARALRFYDSDQSLARIVAQFLREGFERGSPGIVVATAAQRAEIIRALTAVGFDVVALQQGHDLVLLDGDELLATFMVDGKPDAQKFRDELCRLIDSVRCNRADCAVRIFGQMVDVLWRRGDRDAAIRLELLWNQLGRTESSSVVCGYAIGNFFKDARFEDVCGRHSDGVSIDRNASRSPSTAADANRSSAKRRQRR
jgi:hypothetical protein